VMNVATDLAERCEKLRNDRHARAHRFQEVPWENPQELVDLADVLMICADILTAMLLLSANAGASGYAPNDPSTAGDAQCIADLVLTGSLLAFSNFLEYSDREHWFQQREDLYARLRETYDATEPRPKAFNSDEMIQRAFPVPRTMRS